MNRYHYDSNCDFYIFNESSCNHPSSLCYRIHNLEIWTKAREKIKAVSFFFFSTNNLLLHHCKIHCPAISSLPIRFIGMVICFLRLTKCLFPQYSYTFSISVKSLVIHVSHAVVSVYSWQRIKVAYHDLYLPARWTCYTMNRSPHLFLRQQTFIISRNSRLTKASFCLTDVLLFSEKIAIFNVW